MRYFFFSLFLLQSLFLVAQDEVLENNPASLKWYQINTDHFRILFPEGFEQPANRAANTLEHIYLPVAATLEKEPKRIPIILQNQTSVSNAFVTLGPRRSEFFMTPSQDYNFMGTNDWLNLIAVHEYRHIVQLEKVKTGFNRFVHSVLGEDAFGTMARISTPLWYWEGDAVGIETALTKSGRGRIPNFDLAFRANVLENDGYSYYKQHLRSYKDFVPDHYRLGYYMTTYVRRKYGAESWSRILERSNRRAYLPFTFSTALKKETGNDLLATYSGMVDELGELWRDQQEKVEETPSTRVNLKKKKGFTSYLYPQELEDGRIIALKTGIGEIPSLVSIDSDGKEKVEFIPGLVNDAGKLSVSGNRIVWSEFVSHPRWQRKVWSVIKSYNVVTGVKNIVTPRARLASPVYSPSGVFIVAIETTTDQKYSVVIIDANSGNEVKRFENQANDFYAMPDWTADGEKIIVLKTTGEGKSLVLIDVESGVENAVIPPTDENLGHPVVYNQYILYNSAYNGIDNIYAFDTETGQRYRVTNHLYGSYNPEVSTDGTRLYYNNFDNSGMNVEVADLDSRSWEPIGEVEVIDIRYWEPLVEQEGNEDILEGVPDKQYQATRYSKLRHIFRPYNWGPFIESNSRELFIGISSQDVMSTTSTSLGYIYDGFERTGYAEAKLSYQNLFPVFDLTFITGTRRNEKTFVGLDPFGNPFLATTDLKWNERGVRFGLRLPLQIIDGKMFQFFSVANNVGIDKVSNMRNNFNQETGRQIVPFLDTFLPLFDEIGNGDLLFNEAVISYQALLRRSTRDINPKLGFVVRYENYSTPYGGDFKGGLSSFRGILFLPGLAKHHSFFVRFASQNRDITLDVDNYWFRNRTFVPRGTGASAYEKYRAGSFNYTLPIVYPDLALGPVLNIRRIRGNAFFDFGAGFNNVVNNTLNISRRTTDANGNLIWFDTQTMGAEVHIDFNVMRYIREFDIGFRYSYVINDPFGAESDFEVLIGLFGL